MITVKTDTVLLDFKGKPLKNGEDVLTLGLAVSMVLGGKVSNPTWGWIFGKKFATDKTVDLKAEELVWIKKELNESQIWTAVATGQILEILDGEPKEPKESNINNKPKK